MLPAPPTRIAAGGRPVPGLVDRLRVAMPWVWSGLCAAIAPLDGSLRDYVTGNAPSALNVPGGARDPRGGQLAIFSGSAVARQEFADNGNQDRPDVGLTVFCRFRPNGTNPTGAGVFSKPYAATSPYDTWQIICPTANTATFQGAVSVAGVLTQYGSSSNVGTTLFTDIWLRWQSGSGATMTYLRDDGSVASTATASSTLTGSLSYPGTPLPIRVGGNDSTARNSAGGDFSVGMVWNRRLSDQEVYAITFDPFGFLRRA